MARKAKIIVSDLHVGAGFAPDNPLEDFNTDDGFADFLGSVVTESDAQAMDVELIVNGDMVEFLQVPATDTFDPGTAYPLEAYRPTSEEASADKMALVIAGHPTFFSALHDFINPGHPRRNITIVKGNHDVNLYWGAVQDLIRQAVEATGNRRDLLTFEERQVSREGIYVEHGNQYAETANRFDNFEEPLDPDRPGELETPLGSDFVTDFFNDLEREKWWIDAVKPIAVLICYCFAVDFAFAARVLVNLLRAAPGIIADSFAIGGETDAGVQMDELRRQLEDETEVAALAERYTTDEAFRREFDARVGQILGATGIVSEGTRYGEEARALERARNITEMSDVMLRRVAQAKIAEEGVQVVVFGHTHRALCEQLDGGVYTNCGTWVWWRDFSGVDIETWKEFYAHPEDFVQPHYLTYVRVDYDDKGRPSVRLLDHAGQLVIECPKLPRCKFLAWLAELWARVLELFSSSA